MKLNETHDPALRSWVASANEAGCDFPIQNLPFAVFRRTGSSETWRGGVAIGKWVLDLTAAAASGVFSGDAACALQAATGSSLNSLMVLGPSAWSTLRLALSRALREGAAEQNQLRNCLIRQAGVEFTIPVHIGDYTDFYTSIYHATSVGRLFRPANPLMPNYKWVPIGYHGRVSSIVISGHDFHRPFGQTKASDAEVPNVRASQRMDIELELGVFIGIANPLGERVTMEQAEAHVFGFTLLNDWSARDIQPWEYQPLGPFLSKNFATTISPWIVTLEALAPYRVAPAARPAGDPAPLAYLDSSFNRQWGAIDIWLEVWMQTLRMRAHGQEAIRIANSNYRHAYWTFAQMVAHHTVNGCNLQSGDLLGTGTLSGPSHEQAVTFIELTAGGKGKLTLPNGETRTWLEDGDTIVLRGHCQRPGTARIGFGECRGTVLPAWPL